VQVISKKMRDLKEKQKKHSGGSRTFARHALLEKKQGVVAPSLSTYVNVYKKNGDQETVNYSFNYKFDLFLSFRTIN
jgi:hypothetical protein